jgi:hypothetical protein
MVCYINVWQRWRICWSLSIMKDGTRHAPISWSVGNRIASVEAIASVLHHY